MKILTSGQLRLADQITISKKSIESIELMEAAALACVNEITNKFNSSVEFYIFCGPGNNGGDGLAIGRLLAERTYQVKIILLNPSGKLSSDNLINLNKVLDRGLAVKQIKNASEVDSIPAKTVVIDALFGTGLNQAVSGEFAKLIDIINESDSYVISIDMPSGLFADCSSSGSHNCIVKASETYTFQYLKLALLMPENSVYFGKVQVLNIGLVPESVREMNITNFLIDEKLIKSLIRTRPPFSHKGVFGHGLLIAGGKGKMGACIMSTAAFVRSGAGLLTVMVPEHCTNIIYQIVPEAMVQESTLLNDDNLSKYRAIGIGPGLGTDENSVEIMNQLLEKWSKPVLFDADALNILAEHNSMLNKIPSGSVLTPHPGEFRKLFGDWKDDFEKIDILRKQSNKLKCVIVLKGKYTAIALPDGRIYFNPTGNSGMAKGGSGDVLTGLITGLMTSGYNAESAANLGVYIHGLAGDLAASDKTEQGMTASDIINHIPKAWKRVLRY